MENIKKFIDSLPVGLPYTMKNDRGFKSFRIDLRNTLPDYMKPWFCHWELLGGGPSEDGSYLVELYYKTKHQESSFLLGKAKGGELQVCDEICAACVERGSWFPRTRDVL